MNANFGIIKPLEKKIKDKKEKYSILSEIAIRDITNLKDKLSR